ncbi:nucleotidyltransferase [Lactiplantibacillus mudanjiangensis]|uniref:tRNA(Met) cytidine acetate ligase n=1 Tax=Lactiplantibacillus mudanjiangensis TaxID=1296538 RepID=A0A660E324_9LACO|nr:nucleotidyltransferase [Lactiplantibacillus mudanjiangensis]VDG25720.1 nucleotidyltransferase [Lactobacillus sp.] [Lactiplantibacillus mudanjiangensis]VDG29736.1 nucleotidyltransferase [Lactobacillus sp.] [Lactiplantibacillus mudanjiangensis]VDG31301.1 nucleotidyltransferase [Lactobacillus sp.] [Lactiplantibacillus mudanjiangensis]
MRAVGVITEYNPLHNGHVYQLQQAKALTGADCTVVVMSGNWLQRGEPAILDKWTRAQLALQTGADLVIELPVFYAMQPAHLFAQGGVRLLAELGCESLVFGAEHPDLDFSQLMAAFPSGREAFKQFNATYATLFNAALKTATGQALTKANDMLGFCYYVANQRLGAPMRLIPMQRLGSDHNDTAIQGDQFASGTAIRQAALAGNWDQVERVVPAETLAQLKSNRLVSWADFWPHLQYQLLTTTVDRSGQYDQMAEGLEYRMQDMVQNASNFEDFLAQVKSKRYTYTRLQRVAAAALLQLTTTEVQTAQARPYLRVLGFSATGQQYLHQVKKSLTMPLYTKINKDLRLHELALDYRAGRVYELINQQHQDLYRRPWRFTDNLG